MNPFKELLLNSLDFSGYDLPAHLTTDAQKLAYVYEEEFGWNTRPDAAKQWLMGLPTVVSFPFYNSDIHQFYIEKVFTPLPADPVEDYWNQMAGALEDIISGAGKPEYLHVLIPVKYYIAMVNSDESGLTDSESEELQLLSQQILSKGYNAIPLANDGLGEDDHPAVLARFQKL